MMDTEEDEAMLEDSASETKPHTEEQEEEFSGYVDEENYGADQEDFDVAEDDQEMMNF
jgi:hypothetical protein